MAEIREYRFRFGIFMLNLVRMRLGQIAYAVRSDGWVLLFKNVVFLGRTAMFVEKELSEVIERREPFARSKLEMLEIDEGMLSSGAYTFAVKHRHLKALHYLKHGYGGFALVRNGVIVGDFWYSSVLHRDLRRFGLNTWPKSHVYTFDIFVAPAERKNGISAAFQNNAVLSLRSKGYTKAYGFYFTDNIPAVWCTRVTNKWKELSAVRISRFLIFTRVVPLRQDRADTTRDPLA